MIAFEVRRISVGRGLRRARHILSALVTSIALI
jgi:hypothetical protein